MLWPWTSSTEDLWRTIHALQARVDALETLLRHRPETPRSWAHSDRRIALMEKRLKGQA